MQGCSLRCIFCHNPETWIPKSEFIMTPEDIVNKVLKYKNYFNETGGVTFSGGEPLFQSEFLLETLKLCKKYGINTCLDTAGFYTDIELTKEILKYVDLILLDIKAYTNDLYKYITGKEIDKFLEFLNLCQNMKKNIWIRQVIIPGINDNENYILGLKEFISKIKNVSKIELLPYHTMGVSKYEKLNIPYRLKGVEDMNQNKCDKLYQLLVAE
jgi:pyruvate formate lyase activating enzyme